LHDPHLSAAAVLLETSFWEAGICAVQCTDFRNFAHGRHVWTAKHPDKTFVLALTCDRSLEAWQAIRRELPEGIPDAHFHFGRAGRGGLFEAILAMLTAVEAAGALKGIDPGRPGVADYGRRIFGMAHLRSEAVRDDVVTRRKRRAESKADPPGREPTPWRERRDGLIEQLSAAKIRCVVLDYDGTVVSTDVRLESPRSDVIRAIVSLAKMGIAIGFATGRGGSVGERLREHIPVRYHRSILVGYYNGAFIVSLDSDIRENKPDRDLELAELHTRLCAKQLFANGWMPKVSPLQISIPFDKFALGINAFDIEKAVTSTGRGFKIMRSGHSVDVFPWWAGKTRVVEAIVAATGFSATSVLRVGDSGDVQGNDYELLEGVLGFSVDKVCHRDGSCWNPLPMGISGPNGLVRILTALKPVTAGVAKLDVSVLFTH
jgi:hydroxymethylpyrimidine pyrophosphatase-like HAD family hydrolase